MESLESETFSFKSILKIDGRVGMLLFIENP